MTTNKPEDQRRWQQDWRTRNPERSREINRRWQESHPELAAERNRRYVAKFTAANPWYSREKNARRQARLAQVEIEQFAYQEIFERDNWMCGLCGKRINRRRRHPDPLSPSLDHVIPISKGGAHTRANVQASHLRCNIVKGARTAI